MASIVVCIWYCDMADAFEDFWDDIMCNSFVMLGTCVQPDSP